MEEPVSMMIQVPEIQVSEIQDWMIQDWMIQGLLEFASSSANLVKVIVMLIVKRFVRINH